MVTVWIIIWLAVVGYITILSYVYDLIEGVIDKRKQDKMSSVVFNHTKHLKELEVCIRGIRKDIDAAKEIYANKDKDKYVAVLALIIVIGLFLVTLVLNLFLYPFILFIFGNLIWEIPFVNYQIGWILTKVVVTMIKMA